MVEIIVETRVVDGVYVDMSVDVGKGLSEERVVPLGISGIGRVKIL